MPEGATSLDKKRLRQLRQRKAFNYPRLSPRLTRLRDVAGYLKRLVSGANRFPLADQTNSLSCQPLFIVSAGRSGTTLLRSMLVVGGQIAIPPEGLVIGNAARKYLSHQAMGWKDLSRLIVALFESGGQFPLWEVNLAPVYERVLDLPVAERSLARVVDEVYRHYAGQHFPAARLWGDQSPIHSVFLPWIEQTFPEARYLHLLRDGRDVVASMVGMGLAIEYAAERWQVSVERIHATQRSIPQQRFLELRYEHLVREPASALQEVCGFAGIDYDSRMMEYWKLSTTVEHHHFERHRHLKHPLFTDSVGRWRERLSPQQQKYVVEAIGPLLQQTGYDQ